MTAHATNKLTHLIDRVAEGTSGDKVSVGDLLDALDTRSYGPLLLLPALIAASPLGAVPGMSVVTGSIIVLVAGQLLVGRSHPWLPGRLLELSFDRSRLTATRDRMKPWLAWAERPVQARFTVLVDPPVEQAVAVCCLVLAALFYPLALVPFAVFLPAVAICFFALGLSARDGLLCLFGLILTAATAWATVAFWPFS